ncbi:pyroglutamyl-peptidase I [Thalassobacillus hwangdonensis]|uniref:Pyroglutamyl-peptidase I n=1 Tax=Thalassobacillus hwangdonensis TaxID=546108 RepID=A0ABW3L2X8_9BACI
MKKLLLTGFEPFLDFPVNPTQEIVRALDQTKINDHLIIGRILPVDFQQSGKLTLEYINETHPDKVVALGLAAGRHKITPERIAINCNDGDKDNSGHRPEGEPIIEDGPDGTFSTLPIKQITEILNTNGYPAEISNSAGTYLCNNVMYHILQEPLEAAGFIHIPASHDLAIRHGRIPSWSQTDLTEAIKLAITTMTAK